MKHSRKLHLAGELTFVSTGGSYGFCMIANAVGTDRYFRGAKGDYLTNFFNWSMSLGHLLALIGLSSAPVSTTNGGSMP
jgi:hypothetical protein